MNSPFPNDDALPADDGRLESLWVHGLLRGLADAPEAREARLRELGLRLQRDVNRARRWRWSRRVLVQGGIAAAILVGLLVFSLPFGPSQAAETLVRQAQEVHRQPVDRCYLVQWEPQPGLELLARSRETQLWTRGDRFWIATTHERRAAYGRDEQGGFWIARTAKEGIRFDAGERDLPPALAHTWSVCTMQPETLLGEVLHDFELNEEAPDRIRATPKPGHRHPSVQAALLQIDRTTHVISQLTLWRHEATVTFTLIETGSLSDDQYKLEGHLEPGARIYTRSLNPELRRQKLRGG